jgi:uncharacterized membrane protein (DUF2068 family)
LTKPQSSHQLKEGMETLNHPRLVQDPAAEDNVCPEPGGENHSRGLLLVGLFKLSKAIFFTVVGAAALRLIHHDLGDVVMNVAHALHFDPESRLVGVLMDRADLIGHHQLRQAGMFAFAYAALCLVEGWGLITRKSWAEYFTVILTTAALPWETYELIYKFEPYKIGLLLINILVLIYLLWVLKRKKSDCDKWESQ